MNAVPQKTGPLIRCDWVGKDPLYIRYHDEEWGVPKRDDQALFEKLILEGFQAGLSWITVLKKRENFRQAFDRFEAEKMAGYSEKKIESLMQDSGIIRNRAKINAAKSNAKAYLDLRSEMSFAEFFWNFTKGKPIQNSYQSPNEIPAETELSHKLSKALKKRGFCFCGPTIVYAFMQSVGMVNDHLVNCHAYEACYKLGRELQI